MHGQNHIKFVFLFGTVFAMDRGHVQPPTRWTPTFIRSGLADNQWIPPSAKMKKHPIHYYWSGA